MLSTRELLRPSLRAQLCGSTGCQSIAFQARISHAAPAKFVTQQRSWQPGEDAFLSTVLERGWKPMRIPQSTWNWIRERDQAYKRREYIRRLSRDIRRIDGTLPNGSRSHELWRKVMDDLTRLGEVFPER